jgi:hypothetical protein
MKSSSSVAHRFEGYPGAEFLGAGLEDLEQHRITIASLLVLVASPRLRALGIAINPEPHLMPYEHRLYALLEETFGSDAYSRYNALIRRVVSFTRAAESIRIGEYPESE